MPYFKTLALAQGVRIDVEQFAPFRADASAADDPVDDPDWAFAWQVRIPSGIASFPFRADDSVADEPLDAYQTGVLECRLRQAAPAHALLAFDYAETPDGALTGFGDGELLTGADRQILTGR